MKSAVVIGIVIGMVLLGVGYAVASNNRDQNRTIYSSHGIGCSATPKGTVLCVTGNRPSFGISFDKSLVLVIKFTSDGKSHVVFHRWQP